MSKLNCRGQIFSTDLIMALVVFLAILTISIIFSQNVSVKVDLIEQEYEKQKRAVFAAQQLIYSAGTPSNWENLVDLNNVSAIGLANSRNEIDSAKLKKLSDLNESNYFGVRNLLGMAKYDVFISVTNVLDDNVLAEFGIQPSLEQKVASVTRVVFVDGNKSILKLKVFN